MKRLWTNRDLDIVETLTHRVRLLSIEQIARLWWAQTGSLRIVRRRLRRLVAGGLIHRTIANAAPLPVLRRPLAEWKPGEEPPDFEHVTRQAKDRRQSASIPQELFWATKLASNLFGSTARRAPDFSQRDHDLLLAQVYVAYRTTGSLHNEGWVREAVLQAVDSRMTKSDALLVDAGGDIVRLIKSAGSSSVGQVWRFHEDCVQHEIPYELW